MQDVPVDLLGQMMFQENHGCSGVGPPVVRVASLALDVATAGDQLGKPEVLALALLLVLINHAHTHLLVSEELMWRLALEQWKLVLADDHFHLLRSHGHTERLDCECVIFLEDLGFRVELFNDVDDILIVLNPKLGHSDLYVLRLLTESKILEG